MPDVFSFEKARSVDTLDRPTRNRLDQVEAVLAAQCIKQKIEFVQTFATLAILVSEPIYLYKVGDYILNTDVLEKIAMAATAKMASSEVIEDERLQKRLRIDLTK